MEEEVNFLRLIEMFSKYARIAMESNELDDLLLSLPIWMAIAWTRFGEGTQTVDEFLRDLCDMAKKVLKEFSSELSISPNAIVRKSSEPEFG